MFGRGLNPEWHYIETKSAKWCDECRQQAGIWIEFFLPESRVAVQLGEELRFTDLGQQVVNLW